MNRYEDLIKPLDRRVMDIAKKYQDTLVKPPESLGRLEEISIRIAGITGTVKNDIDRKIHFVLGADNGIHAEGIASAPQNFTHLLLGYYADGQNCGINVLCRAANVDLKAVDMGVIGKIESPNIMDFKLMEGTRNFAVESAMTRETAEKAIGIGISLAKYAYDNGYKIIGTGEVGIGNTSSSAACIMAALNLTAEEAGGRGAGLSDERYGHKKEVLTKAVALHAPFADDIDILAKVGGLDIAGLTGIFIGAAIYRLPVIIDGFISAVAAMFAFRINPLTREFMIPSHASEEPGYKKIVEMMGLEPMLDLKMRLGEGTGCPLAMQIVDAALHIMSDMLSFDASVLDEESYKKNLAGV